jgi:hypothetical protein
MPVAGELLGQVVRLLIQNLFKSHGGCIATDYKLILVIQESSAGWAVIWVGIGGARAQV